MADPFIAATDRQIARRRAEEAKNHLSDARMLMQQARLLRKRRDVEFLERAASGKAPPSSAWARVRLVVPVRCSHCPCLLEPCMESQARVSTGSQALWTVDRLWRIHRFSSIGSLLRRWLTAARTINLEAPLTTLEPSLACVRTRYEPNA